MMQNLSLDVVGWMVVHASAFGWGTNRPSVDLRFQGSHHQQTPGSPCQERVLNIDGDSRMNLGRVFYLICRQTPKLEYAGSDRCLSKPSVQLHRDGL